jgi:L,D-transpeptidase YcbB
MQTTIDGKRAGPAFSRVILALAATLASVICVAAHAQTDATLASPTGAAATQIRMRIREGHQPRLRWPEFPHYQAEMEALYAPGGYQPLWVENGKPRRQAGEAIEILRQAETRGLPVEEFDLSYLEEGWRNVASSTPVSGEDLGDLDAATSLLFMRHLSNLHSGRINPGTLSHGLDLPPKKYDLAAAVRRALEGDRLSLAVEEAEPRLQQYIALKAALQRYRDLAQTPNVGPLPVKGKLRPGDRYPAVKDLDRLLRMLGDLGNPAGPDSSAAAGSEAPARRSPAAAPVAAPVAAPLADLVYGGELVTGVKHFQERHGLSPDGIVGPATWKQLNQPLARRVRQIELALERLRWLPDTESGPLVIVNIPSFRLYVFDSIAADASPTLLMNVVVGKAGLSGTPVFADRIRYIMFSPYWYPPRSIIKDEILPGIARDSKYLDSHDMELVPGTSDESRALEASPENLKRLRTGRAWVRQRPGPRNSLGLVKFVLPNSHDIYLHDTPSRSLFARERRDFSHGCIRVQNPKALAAFLLRDQPEWTPEAIDKAMLAGQPRRVDLKAPVQIYILYATAVARSDGAVLFYDDIYGQDQELDRALLEGEPYGR